MAKRAAIKVDPNAVNCKWCRKIAVPKYKLVFGDGKFCSLECIKNYFCNIKTITYESFKCND